MQNPHYVGEMDEKNLVAALKEKLPRYMIPNRIIRLAQMPLTPNGKIDRNFNSAKALYALMEKLQKRAEHTAGCL